MDAKIADVLATGGTLSDAQIKFLHLQRGWSPSRIALSGGITWPEAGSFGADLRSAQHNISRDSNARIIINICFVSREDMGECSLVEHCLRSLVQPACHIANR